MRQRSTSSIGVVVVGLVPAIIGGLVFVIAFTALGLLAFIEIAKMMKLESLSFRAVGYGLIVLGGALAYVQDDNEGLPMLVTASVITPLVVAIFTRGTQVVEVWSRTMASSLYLSAPVFAAISIRQHEGEGAEWLGALDGIFMPGEPHTSQGLGWLLLVLLVTWFSDTGAYLVGKSVGQRKLIPRVSPNKTVEGALGGLACSAAAAILSAWLFELDIRLWLAVVLGIVLGLCGMLGDLAESMLKRQLKAKDSGTLIPGHGGVLDRIDSLLFVLLSAWLLIPILS